MRNCRKGPLSGLNLPSCPIARLRSHTALDGAMGTILPRVIKQDTFSGDDPMVFRGKVPEDRPRFLVAYQNGLIQLMRNESDPSKHE